jgi:membrane associated rhomboid family serine protease
MLPIRDHNPTTIRPVVNWIVIGLVAYVFFFVQPFDQNDLAGFLYAEAAIPCEIVTAEPLSEAEITTPNDCRSGGVPIFPDKGIAFSVIASIFFHGGIGHLIGNLWVLWIFGNNIEDEFGHVRYLFFYVVSGVLATFAHVIGNFTSTVPVVGASGAIAAVMGAYMVLHPSARVTSIIPPLFFIPFRVPAAVFLVIWFVAQFALSGADSNIAWQAHVGGFVVGVIYALMFRRRRDAREQAVSRN